MCVVPDAAELAVSPYRNGSARLEECQLRAFLLMQWRLKESSAGEMSLKFYFIPFD